METTKVSIIIPAYNVCDYIVKCLDSIRCQTLYNIEIIVINDGSTDTTGKVLDEYAKRDDRIKIIHQENSGVTRARFRGMKEATGEFVGFVDGDDYVEPQMYQRLLENAEKCVADIAHCGYQMIFPDGHIDYYYNSGRFAQYDNLNGMKELLEGRIEPGLCNKLFHRDLIHKLLSGKVMDLDIKNNEDLLMNYYLFKQAKSIVYEDICPYHYILRKNSAATSRLNEYKMKNPIDVLEILRQETEKEPVLNHIVEQRLVYQMISVATLALKNQRALIYPYRKKIRKELRNNIVGIITSKFYSKKIKIMALWVAIWPCSYRWIHTIYAKVVGIDKKYNIE